MNKVKHMFYAADCGHLPTLGIKFEFHGKVYRQGVILDGSELNPRVSAMADLFRWKDEKLEELSNEEMVCSICGEENPLKHQDFCKHLECSGRMIKKGLSNDAS